MKTELQNRHVATIVEEYPRTADVFRKAGIDYCCGGKISLNEAVEKCDFDKEKFFLEVEDKVNQSSEGAGQIDMKYLSIPSIIEYVQNRFHKDLKEELANLTPFVERVAGRHGATQPHLLELHDLFEKFKEEMIAHTADEDVNVFPLIVNYVDDVEIVPVPEVKEAVQKLVEDHDTTGNILMRMRKITDGYKLPENACGTYTLVYSRLEALEKQTFEHVYMENHILFERIDELMGQHA
ncbi:iron-sulfur cluster repair di-iron protein [Salinicoccus sp. YB14-2]|uniref:iron-sulfur cluster repair di-iron protein n=1 Tax=Salinicoccus sp. YB14-2 TaxID=1572701 RepID=UPI00068D2CA9|nr:iron-sulfur cluster repair di-iron protein [Salinicoccus sp. YB14-2]